MENNSGSTFGAVNPVSVILTSINIASISNSTLTVALTVWGLAGSPSNLREAILLHASIPPLRKECKGGRGKRQSFVCVPLLYCISLVLNLDFPQLMLEYLLSCYYHCQSPAMPGQCAKSGGTGSWLSS